MSRRAANSLPKDATSPCVQQETPEPTIGLPVEEADVLLPQRMIQGGEIIILILKPSLWYIILSRLGWLITITTLAVGLLWLEERYATRWYQPHEIVTLAMGAITFILILATLDWISRLFVLTDRRIVRQMGFFRPQIFEAPLHRIQHTQLHLSIRERLFGLGTISFSTAGTGFPEALWVMVNAPLEVHRRVVQAIHRYGRHR